MKKVLACMVLCLAVLFGGVFAACTEDTSEEAKDVSTLINEIGAVSDLTLDAKDAIDAARSAYDALSEEDKEAVSNYADLQAAEAELAVLEGIDALTPAITSAATMKSGEEYLPELSGHEYEGVAASVAWSVADVGTTGAAVSADGTVSANGIGRFTLIATVTYEGHNIENQAAATVEVGGYTVSGTVSFPQGNADLLEQASVRSLSGIAGQIEPGENGTGTFTVSVPHGDTTLIFSAPAFEDVVLELKGVASDMSDAGTAEFTEYSYGAAPQWAAPEGRYTVSEGSVIISNVGEDEHAAVAFAGAESTQVYLQATISDIKVGGTINSFDVGFAPILSSGESYNYQLRQYYYTDGSADGYLHGIGRLHGVGTNPWADWANGWDTEVFTEPEGAWITDGVPANGEGVFEGITVTMTLIRDGNKVYVWTQLDGQEAIYHGADVLGESFADYAAGFGLYTRGGAGATFSDITFSTDADFIAEKLSRSVTLNAETEDGANSTVVLQDEQGAPIESGAAVAIGSKVTVVITPKANTETEVYSITEVKIGGAEISTDSLTQQDGAYLYTFAVSGDTLVSVTISVAQSVRVTGTVAVPEGNENLLANGTVSSGSASANINADGTFEIILPQNAAELAITVPGFFKEVAVDLSDLKEYAFASPIALTAEDHAFEQVYVTGGATWQMNDDGSVTANRIDKDAMNAVVFSGLSSDAFVISMTVTDIYSGPIGGTFDVGFSIGLPGGKMLAYEMRESGAVARLCDPGWAWVNGTNNKIPGISDWGSAVSGYNEETHKFDGLTIEMTMVLKDSTVYLWANGVYLGSTQDAAQFVGESAVSFGVYTRAGSGATFSDITFSTDEAVVNGQLAEIPAAEDPAEAM